MKIAITGEKGFIGVHLTLYFKNILKYEVIELGRDYLANLSKINELDWLIHTAFVHRNPNPEKVLELNNVLTKATIDRLISSNIECNVVFLSSIHEELDTFYGQSKRDAKISFLNYCSTIKKEFISFKLPNIFGRYAKPNRTSFIANFCYNLQNDILVNYNQNKINLCCVEDVISIIGKLQEKEIPFVESSVDKVYFLLKEFKEITATGGVPKLKSKFELDLYNTYISYTNYKL
jgi:UDP-2-acetamido-2,6-beta-L-arabino-hexul-4-ose reductase